MVEAVEHLPFKVVIKDQNGDVYFEQEFFDGTQTQTHIEHMVYPKPMKALWYKDLEGTPADMEMEFPVTHQTVMVLTVSTEPPGPPKLPPKLPGPPEEVLPIAKNSTGHNYAFRDVVLTDADKLAAAAIIEKAADVLLRDGWTKGTYHMAKAEK